MELFTLHRLSAAESVEDHFVCVESNVFTNQYSILITTAHRDHFIFAKGLLGLISALRLDYLDQLVLQLIEGNQQARFVSNRDAFRGFALAKATSLGLGDYMIGRSIAYDYEKYNIQHPYTAEVSTPHD
jgi:hypothetical protein